MDTLTVCAWCAQPLAGDGKQGCSVSHGICDGCLTKIRAEMGRIRQSMDSVDVAVAPEFAVFEKT